MPYSFLVRAVLPLLLLLCVNIYAEPKADHNEEKAGGGAAYGPQFNNDATRDTLDRSAIGFLIKANGLKVPSSELEWSQAMGQHAVVQSAWIPFSASPAKTSFLEPRLVLAAEGPPKKPNGLNLDGQLYVAIIPRKDGTKDLEFISRNRATNEFDFGIIRNFGSPGKQVLELADKAKCMLCHRTGGPFFSVTPWSQTLTNPAMLRAFAARLAEDDPKQFGAFHKEVESLATTAEKQSPDLDQQRSHFEHSLEGSKEVRKATLYGIPIFPARFEPVDPANSVSKVDGIVSLANRSLRVSALLKAIPDPKIRDQAQSLATEAAARWALGDQDGAKAAVEQLKSLLRKHPFPVEKMAALQAFRMEDFNPAFPGGVRKFGEKIGEVDEFASAVFKPATIKAIRDHSLLRESGNYKLPKNLLASETASLNNEPLKFAEAVDGIEIETVVHAVGLHDLDPEALQPLLDGLAKPPTMKKQIVDRVLASATFKKTNGNFPQREGLLTAVHRGLEALAQEDHVKLPPVPEKDYVPAVYGVSFTRDRNIKTEPMKTGSKSDKCLACHQEIRKEMRYAPDDKEAWKAWLTSPDVREQAKARAWLKKVQAALEDKSMPPPDSDEFKGFEPKRKEMLLLLKELSEKPLTGMPK